jgi:hypothetical protein
MCYDELSNRWKRFKLCRIVLRLASLILLVILHEICKRKANWIGHILLRNCLLQQVIEGKIKGEIEVTGRRGRRCRKLLVDLNEKRG